MTQGRINFPKVAAYLLAQAESLVPQWLPGGKRRGHEWVCGNLRGEPGDSCSVNLASGKWADFAGGDDARGGDLVSLYAAIHGLTQAEAAAELSPDDDVRTPTLTEVRAEATERFNGASADPHCWADDAELEARRSPDSLGDPEPAPKDAPLPSPSGMSGRWAYFLGPDQGPVLIVCRLPAPDGGKTFRQYTWRRGRMGGRPGESVPFLPRWVGKGYGDQRPLYRLPELLAAPDARVLIVEGEKAADAAQAALAGPEWVVTTWAAGAKAVKKSDWSVLKGRRVVIWPDADKPGREAAAQIAAILMGLGCETAVIPTEGRPDGFDAADAEATEIPSILDTAALVQPPERPVERMGRANPSPARGAVIEPSGAILSDGSAFVTWQALGLDCNGNGQPYATLGNASLVLSRHPDLAGKIWRDTFRDRIYHTLEGDPKPWTDANALRLTAWMNQVMRLPKVGLDTVHHAVELCAANNARNSVTEWLESLVWDGVERLSDWLADCLGVAKTAFTQAVARNWLISMVARAYRPGCQADHMPVLEGNSGAGKSSALSILGGEWYRAAPQAFGSKEFLEAIQGAWLVEIPDMVGFGRREHTQIISAITTRSDVYRASYGRTAQEHPRTAVFAATSETDEYLQDSRGKRRYWPLRCGEISLDALERGRGQLFAEALLAFRAGGSWHEVPREEAQLEQSQREQDDPWLERIQFYARARDFITNSEVATHALEIPVGKQTRADAMRISKCLRDLGYSCKVEWSDGRPVRRYRRAGR